MTILTDHRPRCEPALRVTLELPPFVRDPNRLEIRVAPPAAPAAENAEVGEPTWEDAEWQ